MSDYFTVKLPSGCSVKNIKCVDCKVILYTGDELVNECKDRPPTAPAGNQPPCIEMKVQKESGDAYLKSAEAQIGSINTDSLEQQNQYTTLQKSKLDCKFQEPRSLQEERTNTLRPAEIVRPRSDADVTTMDVTTIPIQAQDDVMSSIKGSSSLRIKDDEQIFVEVPEFEGFTENMDTYHSENACKAENISDACPSLHPVKTRPLFYLQGDSEVVSPYLKLKGFTYATEMDMPKRKLVGSQVDFSYHLKHEFQYNRHMLEPRFPFEKPLVLPSTNDLFPDVSVEYSCEQNIWPLHRYTENPKRYDVRKLPKGATFYSVDETIAFKEERNKVLLIQKSDVFQRIINLDPSRFVPILAYLQDGHDSGLSGASLSPKCGYQIMEYYKDGSIENLFKITVNDISCTCFLEIFQQKYAQYTKIRTERDLYKRPYMFSAPQEYQRGCEALDKQVSTLTNELENLTRNFNSIISQMLDVVNCLHSDGLVHRDIKPHNFLVKRMASCQCHPLIFCHCEQPGFCLLLGDYDSVAFVTTEKEWDFKKARFDLSSSGNHRNIYYRPIELNFDIEGVEINDPKSDVYSLGVSILEIFAGSSWKIHEDELETQLRRWLSSTCKQSPYAQQFHYDAEPYSDVEAHNIDILPQKQEFVNRELSEINEILASVSIIQCSEVVEQSELVTFKQHAGVQTVLQTLIKAMYIDRHYAMCVCEAIDNKWIYRIIQQCVRVCPQKRPCIDQLLQN